MMLAAQEGHVGIVRLLLQMKDDVSATNRVGASPIMLAAMAGAWVSWWRHHR